MKTVSKSELYRRLPGVDEVLRQDAVAALVAREGHPLVAEAARIVLDGVRTEIAAGRLDSEGVTLAMSGMADAVERQLRSSLRYSLRTVINATGVVLHTNLGRAPLGGSALEHVREVSGSYSNLEFDLTSGERGKRDVHVDRLFRQLLQAASAASGATREIATVVVNNNAAAVMLGVNSLAEGGEVIVSRGELVEIGGSFRIPDVMGKSNAVLREVGTTNRTRIADYERAINERTRLLLRVHRSNFEIVGFTEQPSLEELVALGRKRGLPVMEDLGSGALVDPRSFGIQGEPDVAASLRAGVDVVTYSGDKLLGGPQAGMLSGAEETIAKIRANPMFRALRVDKMVYAALEATLLAYVKQDHEAIPALRMMRLPAREVRARAERMQSELATRAPQLQVEITEGESVIGGGAAPGSTLPTALLAVTWAGLSADAAAVRLQLHEPPIITRVEEGRVLLDLRTVFPDQDTRVLDALVKLHA